MRILILFLLFSTTLLSQSATPFIFGDAMPDAPELAPRGEYKVGVRTLDLINKNQPDILRAIEGVAPMYDRDLKIEVWYPAELGAMTELVQYNDLMSSPKDKDSPVTPFSFDGRAARNANQVEGKFPLIVVSHGYLGSRVLMTYLTENLASKGYIVVAIDHKESTHSDVQGFHSTLLNRPKDILFVVDQMIIGDHFLSENVEEDNAAIIGYSMGGYGSLNVGGAGYSEKLVKFVGAMSGGNKLIESLSTNHPEHLAMFDSRIKCVVAFAPWGMTNGVWDAEGLSGLKLPTLLIAGSEDDISGYETGIKAIYEGTTNADRYMLTYMNARHNVAPNPPTTLMLQSEVYSDGYFHYSEPAWDERRINNINQHFVTAYLGMHLKGKDEYKKFFDLPVDSNEKTWEGFKPRSSTGLMLEFSAKAEN